MFTKPFGGFFSSGGRPAKGSLFIAGEAGAELVGNFNGQTEVINEQQMRSLGIPMYAGGTSLSISNDKVEITKVDPYLKRFKDAVEDTIRPTEGFQKVLDFFNRTLSVENH